MKNSYLDGIAVREISFIPDERGFFSEVFRKDWNDLFKDEVVQAITGARSTVSLSLRDR